MSKFGEGRGVDTRDKAIIFFIITLVFICFASIIANAQIDDQDKVEICFFYGKTCPYCAEEKVFLQELEEKYPRLKVNYLVASDNWEFFLEMCEGYNTSSAGVPRTFIGDRVFVAYYPQECDLIWHQGYLARIGCSNQIENAIRELMNLSSRISKADAILISRKNSLVCNFTAVNEDTRANVILTDDIYLVGWWSSERIKSNLNFPDILVTLDAKTGEVLKSEIPSEPIEGLEKPIQRINWLHVSILLIVAIYLVLYLLLQRKLSWSRRYWVAGFVGIVIASFFILVVTTPETTIEEFAEGFPFPAFVFIVALADGFNPCAFTVLIVLLSLLTHTRSRKRMSLIGSVFILTSGAMYFIFIMLLILAISWLLALVGKYEELLWKSIGIIVIIAGIINLKDFFFFKKGISLGISEKNRNRISIRAGKIVRKVKDAETKKALALALIGVIVLAAFVNLVEFGCTAMLPTVYSKAIENRCMKEYGENEITLSSKCFPLVVLYTTFYAIVYIIPLFAILGNFLYSFKSERLSEKQGRILKLAGGIIMLILGAILFFKPHWLMFGG